MPDTADELQKIEARIGELEGRISELKGQIAVLRRQRTAALKARKETVLAEQDSLRLAHTKAIQRATRERHISAFEMRMDGKTFRQIGNAFGGISATAATSLVYRGERLLREEPVDSNQVPPSADDPIDMGSLMNQTSDCLRSENIRTYRDILTLSKHDLLGIRNFGRMCLQDVIEHLAERNLSLSN